jgi:hypothetical protein
MKTLSVPRANLVLAQTWRQPSLIAKAAFSVCELHNFRSGH